MEWRNLDIHIHINLPQSPHFLMFGQEPRLPVDFLLGRVQEPVAGSVHEWVREHQARLQVAFESAQERLQIAAGRRKGAIFRPWN